jgi:lipopolysaccharide transport system ATP-binding protein
MKPILEIIEISKKFRITGERPAYLSLRDSIASSITFGKKKQIDFYALQNVSITLNAGDSLGIIGKNGAGKSTLLKILSKITPPTSGKVISRGRIASLLEVGTGFHYELTGRENIYLNGSILGMKKAEIRKNFDAIVDFSGVSNFLETPLKHYSSGMQLRLAFAVAAFLENEIMIIDEVLTVGDAEFQKKCLGKMEDVTKNEGRTLIFVSHVMSLVNELCPSAVLLENGQIVSKGNSSSVIASYLECKKNTSCWNRTDFNVNDTCFESIVVSVEGSQPSLTLVINFKVRTSKKSNLSFVAFYISNRMGQMFGQAIPELNPFISPDGNEKSYECKINLTGIIPDDYIVGAWLGPGLSSNYDYIPEAATFTVFDSPQPGRLYPHSSTHGLFVPPSKISS